MTTPKTLTIIKPHKVGSYSFDVTYFEQHRASVSITEQPIEFGAKITDHSFVQPLQLTVGGAVSDVALRANPSFDSSTSNARSSSAYQAILKAMYTRDLITVQTGLANYTNMIMISLDTSQDKSSNDVFDFVMTLQQLFIVTVQSVDVPAQFLLPGQVANQASPLVNNGTRLTENPTPQQATALLKVIGTGYPLANTGT